MYGVLIPSLNPNEKLIDLVKELKSKNIENIFIINDGSSKDYDSYYERCKQYGCIVFTHEVNKGKGVAIKTGIREIIKNYENIKGIVTADSDGQHSPKDIIRIIKELQDKDCLIIGTRNLKNKNVPLTSKIGNYFSTLYFKATTGIYLKDTQTGLRGIPKKYFDYSLNIPGDRFEYEMNYLEKMKSEKIQFSTIDIDTIYEEDRISHFRFIKDSARIYKTLIRNIIIALSSAIIDVGLFYLMSTLLTTFLSSIFARVISGIYNFSLSKIWTFEKKSSKKTLEEVTKYLVLFIIQMIISASLVSLIQSIFNFKLGIILLKLLIDLIIFFVNFIVMRRWIFKK